MMPDSLKVENNALYVDRHDTRDRHAPDTLLRLMRLDRVARGVLVYRLYWRRRLMSLVMDTRLVRRYRRNAMRYLIKLVSRFP